MGSTPIVSTARQRACGPTGRRQPGVLAMRVRLPPGPLDANDPSSLQLAHEQIGDIHFTFRPDSERVLLGQRNNGASRAPRTVDRYLIRIAFQPDAEPVPLAGRLAGVLGNIDLTLRSSWGFVLEPSVRRQRELEF